MKGLSVRTVVVASLSALWLSSSVTWAQSSSPQSGTRLACERLKAQIDQTIRDNGARHFLLAVVDNAQVDGGMVREGEAYAGAEVVGSCDGGTRKVVYNRQGPTQMSAPGTASSPEAAEAEESPATRADADNASEVTTYDSAEDDSSADADGQPSEERVQDSFEPETSP
ncbi:DUF1161 domain-containing protein [Salinicola aestuarinus]|uniref:DUF1161 domain-containing protein n=1 Tax=Salinicola aestuarinus TaxID=1949082 RepID=UPI000DA1A01D|nr:DUF1161 domain-containing protein [Salinicola aestuarinus]